AKLGAARMVWSQIIEAFGGEEAAREIDIFANTSSFTSTVYDPYVNVLRGTTEAFSAVVGGINGMNVRPFDEAVGPSLPSSRRIARNIQILLQEEFNLLQPVDPAGGSWYVEALTKQVAESAWKMLQQIDGEGGMAGALTSGFVQKEIAAVLASRFANLDTRFDRAVGTNMYPNTTEQPLPREESDRAEVKQKRMAAIEEYRKGADKKDRDERLAKISAQGSELPVDFMKALTDAFKAGATLCEVREKLNGSAEGPEAEPIKPRRWTEQYEALRRRTEEFAAKTGKGIRIFLANMGPLVQHKPRADFSTAFMEVAGFEVLKNNGFSTVEEAVAAAAQSGADAAVICSTDDTYPELVPSLARGIKESSPGVMVLLAGAPAPEYKKSYVDAGVDEFIHVRANCRQILENIQKARGIV
ncbi:MAG: methylmalonyl-CoA mutase, partial [Synergistaceae bacterium]|nr:methylmalonyl-CoA mutase [Synergistaceae bacterium]